MIQVKKPRTHLVGMSCPEKKDAVFSGEIRQTIRHVPNYEQTKELKYQVGDNLLIFEWTGKPRHSKWGRRLDTKVRTAFPLLVKESGVRPFSADPENVIMTLEVLPWENGYTYYLAILDGLNPPTGVHLKEVLVGLHPGLDFKKGEIFQVIRW